MGATVTATTARPRADESATGVRVDVLDVSAHAGDVELLHDISLSIRPGELVALVGGSGAGKTTLLETMAGLRRPTAGTVTYDGRPALLPAGDIGYVPQDDIIHRALPLRRTLRYAARLRLPVGTARDEVDRIVDETLRDLELADRGDVTVGDLSGGQRKRASIAVELLTRPRVFFLDEPTSGLDPATSADVLRLVRNLADRGVTVVLTTHDPAEIDICDRVVFLTRNGHLAFAGTPDDARHYFEVTNLAHAYQQLAQEDSPQLWAARFAASSGAAPTRARNGHADRAGRPVSAARRSSSAVRAPRATERRHPGSQPVDARRAGGLADPRDLDDGGAVRARWLRTNRSRLRRAGADHLLGGLRRVLLRAHVRAVADRRRVLRVPP